MASQGSNAENAGTNGNTSTSLVSTITTSTTTTTTTTQSSGLTGPPLHVDSTLSIVCGNTRCHWAIHDSFSNNFYPLLFWKTGPVEKWDKEKQTREEWFAHYFPPAAFQRLFRTDVGPSALESNAMFASRRVSMCPAFIISTNDAFLPELIELLKTMPTRVTMIRAQDFGRTTYEGCGVDRVANVFGAERKYGRPAIVIDGGTAMTWTATDAKTGNIRGGGIALGLAMKFKALSQFTDKLPDLDYITVMDRIERCGHEKKPIKLYADNTNDAMITAVLRETALLLAHIVRHWATQNSNGPGKRTNSVTVCLTGGDAVLYQKLLSGNRGYILQKDTHGLHIPPEMKAILEKNINHEGIGYLLLDKTTSGTKKMTNEELARQNCIGQRVIIEKDSKLLRGSVVDVAPALSVKGDKYTVSLEDYTDSTLDVSQVCAALNLYAEKGETEDVESRISVLLEQNDKDKGMLQSPMAKKGRAKRAAEWLTTLAEGKPFQPPDDLQNGSVPGREDEIALKRKALFEAGAARAVAKKKARGELTIDRESILENPTAYEGLRVAKHFGPDGLFFGTIKKYNPHPVGDGGDNIHLWKVTYDDDDKEEYDVDDMVEFLQNYAIKSDLDPRA